MKKPDAEYPDKRNDDCDQYSKTFRYQQAKKKLLRTDITILCDKEKAQALSSIPKHWIKDKAVISSLIKEITQKPPSSKPKKTKNVEEQEEAVVGIESRVFYHSSTGEVMKLDVIFV